MTPATRLHPDTWLTADQLGQVYPPYRKTFPFETDMIDDAHEALRAASVNGMLRGNLKGSLREADALKIYELAYFSPGPILELGTYHGLSASIIATALKNAQSPFTLTSVDLHKELSDLAARNLKSLGLEAYATFDTSDGTAYLDRLAAEGRTFGFVFIDHSHQYGHVQAACERLADLVMPSAFVLFHDFNDPRNSDPAETEYGVYQGVIDGIETTAFEFAGIYGCTALYRRRPLREGQRY